MLHVGDHGSVILWQQYTDNARL